MSLRVVVLGGNWQRGRCPMGVVAWGVVALRVVVPRVVVPGVVVLEPPPLYHPVSGKSSPYAHSKSVLTIVFVKTINRYTKTN